MSLESAPMESMEEPREPLEGSRVPMLLERPLPFDAERIIMTHTVTFDPSKDNHKPVVSVLETLDTDVENAIDECFMSNKWAIVGAFEKPSERRPLHAIRILEENDEEEPTKVAWGGQDYTGEGELSEPNIKMINKLVTTFGSDPSQVKELAPVTKFGENASGTEIEIIKYPLKHGWTLDVAIVRREPRTVKEQEEHYLHRADIYDGQTVIEVPNTHFNIWACPPGKGLETLYFTDSGKGNAGDVVREIEEELEANVFEDTHPIQQVTLR